MKSDKLYTIGEIHRLGFLKTFDGVPYKNKDTVSRLLSRYPHTLFMTRHGMAKGYSKEQVEEIVREHNASFNPPANSLL
jgi:hypothetical protein